MNCLYGDKFFSNFKTKLTKMFRQHNVWDAEYLPSRILIILRKTGKVELIVEKCGNLSNIYISLRQMNKEDK